MVRPKKHLGQHFLRDENIARKIIASLSEDTVNIVEVGPGTGVLSKYLLENPRLNPYFFEIDHEAAEYLLRNFPVMAGKLTEQDFLEADLSIIPIPFTVIGNFPYNISTQILFRVLEFRNAIPEVVGMFQKEVAERIASPPGSKKYGILSVLMKAWYDTEYLFTVNESVFYPPPNVKSAVIRLKRNQTKQLDCDENLFFTVVKTAFNQRRKTLRNALKGLMQKGYSTSPGLSDLLDKRAERLTVAEFVFLTQSLKG
ncbi:MAG: 16S rRNA (adenine(1518)-N(6)/adenine(1519)-N(6))-dimethyltransferase RsmA [Bacteroidetes bacterium]|nr:16S rRNA (adenine(1518)-N(6)/adenine(1519)-N(6))-dimethyltransferase RsmA [Bacteroidota bacterium]